MTKALQRRIELICSILSLTDGETKWRDIQIVFTRNLPQNITDTAQAINQLRGIVSDKTLISLLPFIKDVDAEVKQLQKEKEVNMSMYGFDTNSESDEE
jgi:SPP1 family phage portal protein